MALAPGTRVSHFRIERELGRGGMSVVYLATDEVLHRAVALKLLHSERGIVPAQRERLLREARSAAAVSHHNIAAIYEVGEDNELAYIAMELVRGNTLDALIRAGRLTTDRVVKIATEIAHGLAGAHQAGVIHRDIKPSNIMVNQHGVTKILDFGLARAPHGQPTTSNAHTQGENVVASAHGLSGTPPYMSPEQYRTGVADHRSDQFALGAVIYEMLSGQRAFPGATLAEVAAQVTTQEPAPLPPQVPPLLTSMVARCLAKVPSERFLAIPEVVSALETLLPATDSAPLPSAPAVPAKTISQTLTTAGELTNIAVPSSPFVGRDTALDEVFSLIDSGARLLTIVGPPGMGKTRLAREVGFRLATQQRRPVWFCDLTEATDLPHVCATLARTLGVHQIGTDDQVARLGENLARREPTVVVLDNFERLVSCAAGAVDRLLELAPDTTFVVTTRQVLHLRRETVFDLSPLSIPAAESSAQEASETGAVQLYVQVARTQRADYILTEADTDNVAAIVRRLDGIPLAVELAAARSGIMSAAEIRSRIEQRFRLLKRATPHRGRAATLRGAIDMSWDLMSEPERSTLRQCAVFRGGFTIDAAEHVVELDGNDDTEVMDLVQSLLNKSMLRRMPTRASHVRLGLYESIREYALEHLRSADPHQQTELRHAEYYAGFGDAWFDKQYTNESAALWKRMRRETDNLSAATEISLQQPVGGAVARSVAVRAGLAHAAVVERDGATLQGTHLMDRLLALVCHELPPELHVRVLCLAYPFLSLSDRADEATTLLEQAAARAAAEKLPTLQVDALVRHSIIDLQAGQLAQARARLDVAYAIAMQLEDKWPLAFTLLNQALCASQQGQQTQAAKLFASALSALRPHGGSRLVAACLINLASSDILRGEPWNARDHASESLALFREQRDPEGAAMSSEILGEANLQLGELELAHAQIGAALEQCQSLGDRAVPLVQCTLARVLHHRGEYDAATALFLEAIPKCGRVDPGHVAEAHGYLAMLYHEVGDTEQAQIRYDRALETLGETESHRRQVLLLACKTVLLAQTDATGAAAAAIAQAAALQPLDDGPYLPGMISLGRVAITIARARTRANQGEPAAAHNLRADAAEQLAELSRGEHGLRRRSAIARQLITSLETELAGELSATQTATGCAPES